MTYICCSYLKCNRGQSFRNMEYKIKLPESWLKIIFKEDGDTDNRPCHFFWNHWLLLIITILRWSTLLFTLYTHTQLIKTVPMCLSVSSASCRVARGIMPGSVKAVRRSVAMTNINNKQVTTGTAAVNRGINRRQLKHTQQNYTAICRCYGNLNGWKKTQWR